MSNEDKIISMLTDIQKDISAMNANINKLNHNQHSDDEKLDEQSIATQLEVLDGMRHLLTKEEADELAAAVGV